MLGLMLEAGDPEVDVIYISCIVSVQHIGYLGITWITWTTCGEPDHELKFEAH